MGRNELVVNFASPDTSDAPSDCLFHFFATVHLTAEAHVCVGARAQGCVTPLRKVESHDEEKKV